MYLPHNMHTLYIAGLRGQLPALGKAH